MTGDDDIDPIWTRVIDAVHDITQERRASAEVALELDRLYAKVFRLEQALQPFVGLAAAWDFDPGRRDEIEREIRGVAETLRRNLDA